MGLNLQRGISLPNGRIFGKHGSQKLYDMFHWSVIKIWSHRPIQLKFTPLVGKSKVFNWWVRFFSVFLEPVGFEKLKAEIPGQKILWPKRKSGFLLPSNRGTPIALCLWEIFCLSPRINLPILPFKYSISASWPIWLSRKWRK